MSRYGCRFSFRRRCLSSYCRHSSYLNNCRAGSYRCSSGRNRFRQCRYGWSRCDCCDRHRCLSRYGCRFSFRRRCLSNDCRHSGYLNSCRPGNYRCSSGRNRLRQSRCGWNRCRRRCCPSGSLKGCLGDVSITASCHDQCESCAQQE